MLGRNAERDAAAFPVSRLPVGADRSARAGCCRGQPDEPNQKEPAQEWGHHGLERAVQPQHPSRDLRADLSTEAARALSMRILAVWATVVSVEDRPLRHAPCSTRHQKIAPAGGQLRPTTTLRNAGCVVTSFTRSPPNRPLGAAPSTSASSWSPTSLSTVRHLPGRARGPRNSLGRQPASIHGGSPGKGRDRTEGRRSPHS